MKKLFLTSGLAMLMAVPAFADIVTPTVHDIDTNNKLVGTNPAEDATCQYPTLGTYTGPREMFAKWTANKYSVSYASGTHGTGNNTVNGRTIANAAEYDASYQILGLGTTAQGKSNVVADTGYHFTGWLGESKDANGNPVDTTYNSKTVANRTYQETGSINPYTIAGPLVLTAQWAANRSGAIALDANIYPNNDHSQTALYINQTDRTNSLTTSLGISTVYSEYATALYTTSAFSTQVTPATLVPANNGYNFLGFWSNTNPNTQVIGQTGTVLPSALTDVAAIDGTTTWYAHWEPRKYQIQYLPGKAHGAENTHTVSGNPVTKEVTFDTNYTILGNTNADLGTAFSQTGYEFKGWMADWNIATDTATPLSAGLNTGGTSYSPTNTPKYKVYNATNDTVKLYAQWGAKTYRVNYHQGAHGTITNEIYYHSASEPDALTYDAIYTPLTTSQTGLAVADGYTFTGWSRNSNASAPLLTAGSPMSAAWTEDNGMDLYAAYTANQYTLTYDCGGYTVAANVSGTGQQINHTADYIGDLATSHSFQYTFDSAGTTALTPSSVCRLNGYTPSAWNCVVTNTNTAVTYTAASGSYVTSSNWSVPNNVTCSVTWTPNTIVTTWNANGGTLSSAEGGSGQPSCTFDRAIGIPTVAPTRTGYTFSGWSTTQTIVPAQN